MKPETRKDSNLKTFMLQEHVRQTKVFDKTLTNPSVFLIKFVTDCGIKLIRS